MSQGQEIITCIKNIEMSPSMVPSVNSTLKWLEIIEPLPTQFPSSELPFLTKRKRSDGPEATNTGRTISSFRFSELLLEPVTKDTEQCSRLTDLTLSVNDWIFNELFEDVIKSRLIICIMNRIV
jgi:hypothetical protein